MVDGMLFEQRLWSGLADGSVTVAFRRWKRPRARVGGRHRTPAGVLAAHDGPWTIATLRLIGDRPGVRAAELAAAAGRERLPFKADVRKLKELGLTESLEVGYRLSPRGRALLARAGSPRARE